MFIAALQTRQWDRLVELVGDPRLKDAALRDADYRNEYPELVVPILQEFTARFDCWPLTQALQHHGVPAAPWSTVADVAANAHLNERGFFVDFEQSPAAACGAPARCFAPPPRPCAFDVQPRSLGSTSTRSGPRSSPRRGARPHRLGLGHGADSPEGVRILDLSRAWAGLMGPAIWRISAPMSSRWKPVSIRTDASQATRVMRRSTATNAPSR